MELPMGCYLQSNKLLFVPHSVIIVARLHNNAAGRNFDKFDDGSVTLRLAACS